MSDDEVHVIPADGQSAEEVAEIFTTIAAEQGLEDEVKVDGEKVIVPRSLSVRTSNVLTTFPPRSDIYSLTAPIELYGTPEDEPGDPFTIRDMA
ncbi:hypothetical protein [Streptomyces sp. NPDC018610]|uniref:hypothetical protein n=1 Tax=Streptomyces sp. NPDC018610 TaxID=3365049 RepID=UPI00379529B3